MHVVKEIIDLMQNRNIVPFLQELTMKEGTYETSRRNDAERKKLKLETGRLAKQANGAVQVSYGDTVVLCTVTASNDAKGS